jgi:hypothetical protein
MLSIKGLTNGVSCNYSCLYLCLSYNFHYALRLFLVNSINKFVFVMKRSVFSVDGLHASEGQLSYVWESKYN